MKDLEGRVECPWRPSSFHQLAAAVALSFGLGFATGWFFREIEYTKKKPAEQKIEMFEGYELDESAIRVFELNWPSVAAISENAGYSSSQFMQSVGGRKKSISADELKQGFDYVFDRESFVNKILQPYNGPSVVPVASKEDRLRFELLYERNSKWRPFVDELIDTDVNRVHSEAEKNVAVYKVLYQR